MNDRGRKLINLLRATEILRRARSVRHHWLVALLVGWCAIVIYGIVRFSRYESEPGAQIDAPKVWPSASHLSRDFSHPTLVLVVHPQCPCTRASITEFSSLMTEVQGRARAYVVFLDPEGWDRNAIETTLWNDAQNIPNARVVDDHNGYEAKVWGALTSGQTYLYDVSGQLLFQGGITSARGQIGASAGHNAILALLSSPIAGVVHTSTFGCPLFSDKEK